MGKHYVLYQVFLFGIGQFAVSIAIGLRFYLQDFLIQWTPEDRERRSKEGNECESYDSRTFHEIILSLFEKTRNSDQRKKFQTKRGFITKPAGGLRVSFAEALFSLWFGSGVASGVRRQLPMRLRGRPTFPSLFRG